MNVKRFLNVAIAMICICAMVTVGCKKKEENTQDPTPSVDSYPPVTNIMLAAYGTSVDLSWEKDSTSNPVTYSVMRNDVLVKTTTQTSFIDIDLAAGTYQYCVIANYLTGSSDPKCEIAVILEADEDYAHIIAGDYNGTISFLTETQENVTISLNYYAYNQVSFVLNNVLTYQGITIPLAINKQVVVEMMEDGKYHFNFEDTVEVPVMGSFPITVDGNVENDILTVNVTVNNIPLIGVLQVLFEGTKQ